MRRSVLALAVPLLAISVVTACGGDDDTPATEPGQLEVIEPWARIARADLGAAYFIVVNGTDADVRLTGATSSTAEYIEIHETTMDAGGMMSMNEMEGGFEIAAGERLVLEPGGKHLMLFGFSPGDATEIDLVLDFDGTSLAVTAPIDFEASGEMGMDMDEPMGMDMDEPMGMDMDEPMGMDMDEPMYMKGVEWVDGDLESITAALDLEALHVLDVDLNAGILDVEMQLPVAQRALAVTQRAQWPIDTDPSAFEQALVDLVTALEGGNLSAAAAAAKTVHDVGHDLEPHPH